MVLAAKGLSYKVVEITPGIGQLEIFRLSGQRQVPVLSDGETIIADSSAIIRYLEVIAPDPRLTPEDPKEAAQMHLIEDWADTTLARAGRKVLLKAVAKDRDLRVALLPEEIPLTFRQIIEGLPHAILNGATTLVKPRET